MHMKNLSEHLEGIAHPFLFVCSGEFMAPDKPAQTNSAFTTAQNISTVQQKINKDFSKYENSTFSRRSVGSDLSQNFDAKMSNSHLWKNIR